jgi:hypothetical protein
MNNQFIEMCETKLREKSTHYPHSQCLIWQGWKKHNRSVHGNIIVSYGRIRVLFPGRLRPQEIYVHKLRYILRHGIHAVNKPRWDISHLCHRSLCSNIDHLSYEPHTVNNIRLRCSNLHPKRCVTHGIYPDCILN